MTGLKLFSIPFAGGSSYSFSEWQNRLQPEIDYEVIDFPGRGTRGSEEYLKIFWQISEDIYTRISEYASRKPYLIMGHSMGAYLAFDILCRLQREKKNLPRFIILSGAVAADRFPREELVYKLGLEQSVFMEYIKDMGAIPESCYNNKAILNRIYINVKEDLRVLSTYQYRKSEKVDCEGILFAGIEDSLPMKDIKAWNQLFRRETSLYLFEGRHMFLVNDCTLVIERIRELYRKSLLI